MGCLVSIPHFFSEQVFIEEKEDAMAQRKARKVRQQGLERRFSFKLIPYRQTSKILTLTPRESRSL